MNTLEIEAVVAYQAQNCPPPPTFLMLEEIVSYYIYVFSVQLSPWTSDFFNI